MLRLIAIDRAIHFVLLAGLAVLLLVFASHVAGVRRFFTRVVADYDTEGFFELLLGVLE